MIWFWKQKHKTSDEILFFEYDIVGGTLIITLSNGSKRVHHQVRQGYVVGLKTADDKLDYYRSEILPTFPLADDDEQAQAAE